MTIDYKQLFKDHACKYVLSVTDNMVMFYPVESLQELNAVKLALEYQGYQTFTPCLVDKESVPLSLGLELLSCKKDHKVYKPSYCTQNHGDCLTCSLRNYNRDCQNNPIKGK